MNDAVLARTESVCPVCLRTIAAQRVRQGDEVHLVKHCPEHGRFSAVVWRGLASYHRWLARGPRAATPPVTQTPVQRGCPHDCGLCPDHRQHSCCVLLEVTARCNLRCPVCFASAGAGAGTGTGTGTEGDDPTLAEIDGWLDRLKAHGSPVNVQLSGGEPTLRDDLPAIVRHIRARGFDFVQVNTNGLRLAREPGCAQALADAGLDCVFLQFDGLRDATFQRLRGARLLAHKLRALDHCARAGLAVVLVPTLVPGVNVDEIGALVEFARSRMPTVRALHFQPISYFGRYPTPPTDAQRLTLPEVMTEIERQTGGRLRLDDFAPGGSEHALCSFVGSFGLDADGQLCAQRVPAPAPGCDGASTSGATGCGCGQPAPVRVEGPRSRRVVARLWAADAHRAEPVATPPGLGLASFDAFLASRGPRLGISGMAFQDAWTLDLERLRECFIHIVSPDRRIVPFCACNLSAADGHAPYRQPAHDAATA